MSLRVRSLRTLFAQRSLHTTSLAFADSPGSGAPKPRTAADLGFGTSNASRTRNLDMFDLETVGGNIGRGSAGNDISQRRGPRADRPQRGSRGTEADGDGASSGDFFEHSKESSMPSRTSLAAKGQRRRLDVDASLIDFDNNVSPSSSSGSRPPRDGASRPMRFKPKTPSSNAKTAAREGGAGSRALGQHGPRQGPPSQRAAPGGPRGQRGPRTAGGPGGPRRRPPGGGRGGDAGDASLQAARGIWEGAPLPIVPVDLGYKSLFGPVSVLDAHLNVDWRQGVKAPWADGMTLDEARRKQALRTAGDVSTLEPSSARPQPGKITTKDLGRHFEWQLAFNRNLTDKHNVQLQKAVETVTKAVA